MNVNEMTIDDFQKVPYVNSIGLSRKDLVFTSLVIIPKASIHESGYRCMDFVAVDENEEPICRLSGVSDILQIDGIGGYGLKYAKSLSGFPNQVKPVGWSIDCLAKSGYLRLFCNRELVIMDDYALSSFEIYVKDAK